MSVKNAQQDIIKLQRAAGIRPKRFRCARCSKLTEQADRVPDRPEVDGKICRWCNIELGLPRSNLSEPPAKVRARYRKRQPRVDALLKRQKNRCAICGKKQKELQRALAIDHCHKKGHDRGLLCNPCNLGLGMFGDDPARLRAAATYLERNSGEQTFQEKVEALQEKLRG